MAGRGAGPDFVESLARGLDVLQCFSAERPRMSLSEIAEVSGLARPTARRLLLTLQELGFVRLAEGQFLNAATAREPVAVLEGEVIDAAVMRRAALDEFLAAQVADAKELGVLFSVHLKATMMKVSDPIIFGHAVRAYFRPLFAEHEAELKSVGASANDGMAGVLTAIDDLPEDRREAAKAAIEAAYADGPSLAMVDSDRGITNLHVPSDVIIDASMPAAIRASGQMWNRDGEQEDTKFVIPDHSYAPLYAETLDHCRENGAFDPATSSMASTASST